MRNEYLKQKVWMIFNDKEHCEALKYNFTAEFPEGTFGQKVHFRDKEVGECRGINEFLTKNTMVNGKMSALPFFSLTRLVIKMLTPT